jgi:hypothetical protein
MTKLFLVKERIESNANRKAKKRPNTLSELFAWTVMSAMLTQFVWSVSKSCEILGVLRFKTDIITGETEWADSKEAKCKRVEG